MSQRGLECLLTAFALIFLTQLEKWEMPHKTYEGWPALHRAKTPNMLSFFGRASAKSPKHFE
jgi:hypothetical protein